MRSFGDERHHVLALIGIQPCHWQGYSTPAIKGHETLPIAELRAVNVLPRDRSPDQPPP
jgi:hypothetical protein